VDLDLLPADRLRRFLEAFRVEIPLRPSDRPGHVQGRDQRGGRQPAGPSGQPGGRHPVARGTRCPWSACRNERRGTRHARRVPN